MNREIKFRAWDGKKMREVARIDFNNNLFDLMLKTPTESAPDHWCLRKLSDTPLMQFTGLHDKNGKEIYEGDILTSIFGDGKPTQICFGEFTCSTYEKKDLATQIGFYWLESDGTKSIFGKSVIGNMNYCEVVGNIYENPELCNP